jgi:CRISPR-associated protein Csh2
MARTREFVLFSDCTMANANGDMINDNRPRQDERTGKLEMSDVRIKRYIRDEWNNRGEKVFVKPVKNADGKFVDCKTVAKNIIEEEKIKKEELENKLKSAYKDVKLFGAVVTEPKFNITGPLQIMWSRSLHNADIKFAQGTSVFTSKATAEQGTIWSKYFTPYALFKTYMVYNDMVAKRQNIEVSENDLEDFKDVMLSGIKNYKSTSKNQMPRLLVEVVYNRNYIDGELDYVKVNKKLSDLELRSISEFVFDLEPLSQYFTNKKDVIEEINIYKHPNVELINESKEFKYFSI